MDCITTWRNLIFRLIFVWSVCVHWRFNIPFCCPKISIILHLYPILTTHPSWNFIWCLIFKFISHKGVVSSDSGIIETICIGLYFLDVCHWYYWCFTRNIRLLLFFGFIWFIWWYFYITAFAKYNSVKSFPFCNIVFFISRFE